MNYWCPLHHAVQLTHILYEGAFSVSGWCPGCLARKYVVSSVIERQGRLFQ